MFDDLISYISPLFTNTSTALSLKCGTYDCSCSAPVLPYHVLPNRKGSAQLVGNMTSTVVIDGRPWNLSAPPLDIDLRSYTEWPSSGQRFTSNMSEFWSRADISMTNSLEFMNGTDSDDPVYMFDDATLELHNLSSRKRGGSAVYRGLIGGDGESNVEAVTNSDDRSSAKELAPSLGGRRTSTEILFHDGAVLEGSFQESSLAGSTHVADVLPQGWGSHDRLPRMR